jgi:hypothetical protein
LTREEKAIIEIERRKKEQKKKIIINEYKKFKENLFEKKDEDLLSESSIRVVTEKQKKPSIIMKNYKKMPTTIKKNPKAKVQDKEVMSHYLKVCESENILPMPIMDKIIEDSLNL